MTQELKNIITNENVITKTSVEVAEMVGKAHNKLMRDIRGYIEDLKDSPKVDSRNLFVESTYINKQNKEQPCYLVTEKGCEFIANKLTGKKGSEFTAKYVEAFHDMKDALVEIETTIQEHGALTQSEWNKIKKKSKYLTENIHSGKSTKEYIKGCDLMHLQDVIDEVYNVAKPCKGDIRYEILDSAIKTLTDISSEYDYSNPMNTFIKTVADNGVIKLQSIQTEKLVRETDNKDRKIGKLKAELESLKPTPLEDMVCINYHAFSYDNSAIDKDGHWKPAYRTWIKNFPMEDIPSIDYWLDRGVDFNKPVKIIIKCVNKKEFDTTNLVKAIQDVLFNKERGKYRADDNFIRAGEIETIGFCDDYSDGKMYIDLENIDNCNIIDTNMDANMNEQLHNQEFAEFVSNLFGDF